jgi:cell division protease FtsH
MSKTELLEKIDVLLGGRGAERVIFNEITTGAQNDLQRATDIARSMVAMYGMNEKLGQVTYLQQANQFLQQGLFQQKEFSDQTALLIDEEVRKIIDERMVGVEKTLVEQRPLLEKIAKTLLEKEALDDEEFKALLAEGAP